MNDATSWILHNSVTDGNYSAHLVRLTEEQLAYCLEQEKRPTSRKKLLTEVKRRGLLLLETEHGALIAKTSPDENYPGIFIVTSRGAVALVEFANGKLQGHLWNQDCDCDPVSTVKIESCEKCAAV